MQLPENLGFEGQRPAEWGAGDDFRDIRRRRQQRVPVPRCAEGSVVDNDTFRSSLLVSLVARYTCERCSSWPPLGDADNTQRVVSHISRSHREEDVRMQSNVPLHCSLHVVRNAAKIAGNDLQKLWCGTLDEQVPHSRQAS